MTSPQNSNMNTKPMPIPHPPKLFQPSIMSCLLCVSCSKSEFVTGLEIHVVIARELPELTPRLAAEEVGTDRAPYPVGETIAQLRVHEMVAVAGVIRGVCGKPQRLLQEELRQTRRDGMTPALVDRETGGQRGEVGIVVVHDFCVVLKAERDILHRLYLVTGEQPRLRVGHGEIVPRTVLARSVISRFQTQHPFSRTP